MPKGEDKGKEKGARSRAFWSGTISFGLVSVPVEFYPANVSNPVGLRMLAPDGTPLERRYYCTKDGDHVSWNELTRGYELDGEIVEVTEEELEAVEPAKSRDIDLRNFVPRKELDPMFFRRAYYLAPAGQSVKAYRLLVEAMEASDRAGIATFVMRGKEYLVAIISEDGLLRAETLRFEDEIRKITDVGLPEGKPKKTEVKKFDKAIRDLTAKKLDLDQLHDDWSLKVREYVTAKFEEGEDVVESSVKARSDDEEGGELIDLMEALRRSLGDAGKNAKKPKRAAKKKSTPTVKASLSKLSKSELYEKAQELDIAGRSSMSKKELAEAIAEE
ncbi:MAG: Ku protein [Acidobacteria bacterium]|nr:Ku protein [Acidobacteriota bacterium]